MIYMTEKTYSYFLPSEQYARLVFKRGNCEDCKVTIIIPTYRRCHLLLQALTSAESQVDCEPYSVIVVDNDDSSDDHVLNLVKASRVENLQYYRNQENLGQIANWNMGIQLAKSEWIVLLHDDDRLMPNYLSAVMRTVNENNQIDVLFTMPLTDDQRQNRERKRSKIKRILDLVRNFYKKGYTGAITQLQAADYYYDCGYNAPIAPLYRRSVLIDFGGFPPQWFPVSDWVFHTQLSMQHGLYVLSEFLCIRGVGVNDSLKLDARIGFVEKSNEFRKQLLEEYHFLLRNVWIQSALWYHAKIFYNLDVGQDLPKGLLNPKYNSAVYRCFYRAVVYIRSFFKKYYLQTEKYL